MGWESEREDLSLPYWSGFMHTCNVAAAIPSGWFACCQLLCSTELANSKNGQLPQEILYSPSGHMVISSTTILMCHSLDMLYQRIKQICSNSIFQASYGFVRMDCL